MLRKFAFFIAVMMVFVLPVTAQDGAGGLLNPRHITFGPDGSLYITQAGSGGDIEAQGPFGPAFAGASSGVSVIRPDGTQEWLLHSQSSLDWGFGDVLGVHAVYPAENSLWVLFGQGDRRNPFNYALVELDTENNRVLQFVDLYTFEATNNPDGEIIDSNPIDFAVAADGTIYIADAGANSVLKWTQDGGLELFQTWAENNPVPTSVEVDDEGSVYVSFLSSFPYGEGWSSVEKYSAAGELVETMGGLTAVVDLELHDGTLYAVELGRFGDEGWTPDSGRIVTVSADGVTPFAENLNLPFGMAFNSEGQMYVTLNSTYTENPSDGMVVPVNSDGTVNTDNVVMPPMATEEVPVPAATEDAG